MKRFTPTLIPCRHPFKKGFDFDSKMISMTSSLIIYCLSRRTSAFRGFGVFGPPKASPFIFLSLSTLFMFPVYFHLNKECSDLYLYCSTILLRSRLFETHWYEAIEIIISRRYIRFCKIALKLIYLGTSNFQGLSQYPIIDIFFGSYMHK